MVVGGKVARCILGLGMVIEGKVERCILVKGRLQGVLVDLGRLVIEELSCLW